MGSVIDPQLVAEYRRTEYRVRAEPPFTLTIGCHSPELLALFRKSGTESAAFITAWNPFSQASTPAQNEAAQRRFLRELDGRGLQWFDGLGVGADSKWDPEPSVLVLGLTHADASAIGVQYRQNAIVWAGADAIPALVLLR